MQCFVEFVSCRCGFMQIDVICVWEGCCIDLLDVYCGLHVVCFYYFILFHVDCCGGRAILIFLFAHLFRLFCIC